MVCVCSSAWLCPASILAGMGHVMSDAEWFLVMSEEYEESEEKRLLRWNFHYWYHYLNTIKLSIGLGFFM